MCSEKQCLSLHLPLFDVRLAALPCRTGTKSGRIMASNFKISFRRDNMKFQLLLAGDFDGTSACELLNILKEKCGNANHVAIDTTGLRRIYPFGRDTFRNNLYNIKDSHIRLKFMGKNAKLIAPK
jgi:hypothetical protein